MNSVGISADRFNEKMLQIANALKPLGVYVECEKTYEKNYKRLVPYFIPVIGTTEVVMLSFWTDTLITDIIALTGAGEAIVTAISPLTPSILRIRE